MARGMTIRTTRTAITFHAPWKVPGFDALPAGTYEVDTDEEVFEGNARTVYQRVRTALRIPTAAGFESHPVVPEDLEKALERDARLAGATSAAPGTDEQCPSAAEAKPWRWVPLWVRTSAPDGRK
jgi:hypothetical protein